MTDENSGDDKAPEALSTEELLYALSTSRDLKAVIAVKQREAITDKPPPLPRVIAHNAAGIVVGRASSFNKLTEITAKNESDKENERVKKPHSSDNNSNNSKSNGDKSKKEESSSPPVASGSAKKRSRSEEDDGEAEIDVLGGAEAEEKKPVYLKPELTKEEQQAKLDKLEELQKKRLAKQFKANVKAKEEFLKPPDRKSVV